MFVLSMTSITSTDLSGAVAVWPGLDGNWAAAAWLVSLKADDDDHQYVVVVV